LDFPVLDTSSKLNSKSTTEPCRKLDHPWSQQQVLDTSSKLNPKSTTEPCRKFEWQLSRNATSNFNIYLWKVPWTYRYISEKFNSYFKAYICSYISEKLNLWKSVTDYVTPRFTVFCTVTPSKRLQSWEFADINTFFSCVYRRVSGNNITADFCAQSTHIPW
jgi:hypothetical protein